MKFLALMHTLIQIKNSLFFNKNIKLTWSLQKENLIHRKEKTHTTQEETQKP
jgi:hypothetical protein